MRFVQIALCVLFTLCGLNSQASLDGITVKLISGFSPGRSPDSRYKATPLTNDYTLAYALENFQELEKLQWRDLSIISNVNQAIRQNDITVAFRDNVSFLLKGLSEYFSQSSNATASLTVTNVSIHYVVNSIVPELAHPVTNETGFINIITEVKSCGAVSVPITWKSNYSWFEEKFGDDFTKSLMKPTGKCDGAGNAMLVWQDYVAGTDPTNPDDKFMASVTMVDGEPVISWMPELPADQADIRKYTTYGKARLQDAEWTVVNGDAVKYNFFKVTVEMK